jgi:hypothetical protein
VETISQFTDDRALMANVVPGDVAEAGGDEVASSEVLTENNARGMQ